MRLACRSAVRCLEQLHQHAGDFLARVARAVPVRVLVDGRSETQQAKLHGLGVLVVLVRRVHAIDGRVVDEVERVLGEATGSVPGAIASLPTIVSGVESTSWTHDGVALFGFASLSKPVTSAPLTCTVLTKARSAMTLNVIVSPGGQGGDREHARRRVKRNGHRRAEGRRHGLGGRGRRRPRHGRHG